jgi:alkylation response protein AidB-like acyl-CoA dehydrogenase
MDMTLSPELAMLHDTVAKAAAKFGARSPSDIAGRRASDAESWDVFVDLGLLDFAASMSADDHGAMVSALAASACGAELVTVPTIGSALAARLLALTSGASELLAEVVTGQQRLTVGLSTRLDDISMDGQSFTAWDAQGARRALVLTERHEGFDVCATDIAGATASQDPTRMLATGELTSREVIGELASEDLDAWRAFAFSTIAADGWGVMSAALDLAVGYAKSRRQYGVAIGSFQAIQHMLADCYVTVEACRTAFFHAAWACDQLATADALRAARIAKAAVSAGSRAVTEAAIQVHGGIGFTLEHRAHLYLRRALLDRESFGHEGVHHRALGRSFLAR